MKIIHIFLALGMTFERKMNGFIFRVSKNASKKYDAFDAKTGRKLASFGARGMEHFADKIGYYREYDHKDARRRESYYARHGRHASKHSAKWFAHNYLW